MTDAALGEQIVAATAKLKRARAECATIDQQIADMKHQFNNLPRVISIAAYHGSRGITVGPDGDTVNRWPSYDEFRAALKAYGEKRQEVEQLQKTVRDMTGLDATDLQS